MDQQQARLWLAIALSMLVWLGYEHFVLSPARQAREKQTVVADEGGGSLPSPAVDKPVKVAEKNAPQAIDGTAAMRTPPSGQAITVETPLFLASITPRGGRLVSFSLKKYRASVDRDSPRLDLVHTEGKAVLPLTTLLGTAGTDDAVEYHAEETAFVLSGKERRDVVLRGKDAAGRAIVKTLSFDASSYVMGLHVSVGGDPSVESLSLIIPKISQTGGYSQSGDHAVAIVGDKLVEHSSESMVKEPAQSEGVTWAGFTGAYFASVGVPADDGGVAIFGAVGNDPVVRLDVAPQDGSAHFLVFLGPKDRDVLEGYGHKLDRLIDYGWFWFIASPMLWLLHRIYDVVSNYGISIIIVTLLLKAVTFPLNQVSMTSMRKMQEIQPEMQRLKERHKDDPAALQREMMEIYKKHNVNPFSGCLPMLIQIPVFIGLYNGLLRDISLRHAPFIGWINDLSAPDRLHFAGVGIPVLTLLMGASMLLQQLTAPAQGDPTQRRMMMIMPVVFTFMFINFPSGLVLYWLVNNVISIGQQYLAMRST